MTREKQSITGIPIFAKRDSEIVEKEKIELQKLSGEKLGRRFKWYLSKSGPGWMQSAMTLGGGSAMASLFAGAFLQFEILWVQPFAMLLGIIMLSALAHQTLSTNTRPFHAMKTFIHPVLAWTWAIATLFATIIWHFPQYALAAGMSEDILNALFGLSISDPFWNSIFLFGIGVVFLSLAVSIAWNYGNGAAGIKLFERIIKIGIWLIILCFATVVAVRGFSDIGIEWGKVFLGFLPFNLSFSNGFSVIWNIPTDPKGIEIFIAAFSAAIGVNATFLFGYTYLAKGWGKEHRGLAKFDMLTGMLIPYTIATSLMIIAAGTTIYGTEALGSNPTSISPMQAASLLEAAGIPAIFSRLIFGFGIIGMAFNAIVLHMLVCGFAFCELFNITPGGWKYKFATLVPVPGILGTIFWADMGTWIAIPTSAICLIMLPIAYIGFFLLNNNEKYLAEEKPRGKKALIWNIGMIFAILITVACVIYYLVNVVPEYL